jgi:hypothetical protein
VALWLLLRLAQDGGLDLDELASRHPVERERLVEALAALVAGGLVAGELPDVSITAPGGEAVTAVLAARQAALERLVSDWEHGDRPELEPVMARLSEELTAVG